MEQELIKKDIASFAKNLCDLDDKTLAQAHEILFEHEDPWKFKDKQLQAMRMKSVFKHQITPNAPFTNWVNCIKFLCEKSEANIISTPIIPNHTL